MTVMTISRLRPLSWRCITVSIRVNAVSSEVREKHRAFTQGVSGAYPSLHTLQTMLRVHEPLKEP